MKIEDLQKTWDAFGKSNSFWSILTHAGEWNLDQFFQLGQVDIDGIMEYVDSLKINLRRHRALDFGCGAGRLTQALCRYFDQCAGVDIAPSMIDLANRYNRFKDRCRYYLNEAGDLRLFEDNHFDFIYTTLVLQHMPPEYSKGYIKEFLRVLAPGGLAVFHLPAELITLENAAQMGRCAATGPLPDSAFKAKLRIVNPTTEMTPRSQQILTVEVTNLSDVVWPSLGMDGGSTFNVKVGNHWLTESGEMLIRDDDRASLPHDVKPQETVHVQLPVTSPKGTGRFILEVDVVQENYTWFHQMGSETARALIRNEAIPPAGGPSQEATAVPNPEAAESVEADPNDFAPRMQMHGVPKNEVIECVTAAGGKVVDIQDDFSAGNEWISYRYCVTK